MGTSFDCPIAFTANPHTGQIVFGVGPFDMGNLAEMLEYLSTEEFRANAVEAAARALTSEDSFTPVPNPDTVVHLRGMHRTACGLALWITDPHTGHRHAAVRSVSHQFPGHVTCEDCRYWWQLMHR